ncbi:endolytic transglycosylase MltG [Marinobacterium jannaschii]|uniref:endolytic transglycosylase MltG n=1 Tax=Marinobacterium jannaschii TaxID=64970 RepID=UPI000487B0D5|nr:endolytic transglycosylase MltG [Marinobacterium jannaschii]
MKKVVTFALVLILITTAAGFVGWNRYQAFLATPLALAEERVLTVEKGTGFSRLASQLQQEQLIEEPLLLKLYGRLSKLAARVKAGEYLIKPGTTPVMLIDQLVEGKSISYNFTIVEGTSFAEMRRSLEANEVLKQELSGLSETELLKKLGIQYKSAEGIFLAETFSFHRGASDLDILKRSHAMLTQTLDRAWKNRPAKLPYKNMYEALIMASIVEKETARSEERPQIAGVFVRRLWKGMRLQTDPTVIYGMGERYEGNITRADLRRPTPYNTYVINGLPPTPIALVGPEAITAALNPQHGKSLYFVAKGDGSHQFSATLNEHNRAVRKYQLKRRKDYRSSP